MLVGVLSTPPSKEQLETETAKDWFGSPSIAMPRRLESNLYPPELTISPKMSRRIARAIIEFIRIILPETAIICFTVFFITFVHMALTDEDVATWEVIVLFPVYYLAFMGIPSLLLTLLLKWVFIGKYTARQKPMWTCWYGEAKRLRQPMRRWPCPFCLLF